MKSWLILAALAGVLAGCSGGGATGCGGGITPIGGSASGSSNGCGTTGPTTPVAADLIVTVSTKQASGILNTGKDTATVTVQAVDSNRNVVADVPVTIKPDDTAVVTASGTTTDTTGTVTGVIGIGSDQSDRTIAVSVVSGSLSKVVNIPVTGATLKADIPAQLTPGATANARYTLTDAAGNPMAGVTVNLSGTFTASGVTDSSGVFVYPFTAPSAEGQIDFEASAAGTSTSNTALNSSTATIPPAAGTVVSSSMGAGSLTVPVNTQGSTANFVDIQAKFMGDHNAAIQNVRVRFDLDGDPNDIGGTLSSSSAVVYSDVTGIAGTRYTPGTRSSGSNGVVIRACWDYNDFAAGACPNQMLLDLTVLGQSVSLVVATDGTLKDAANDSTSYQQAFSVQVTDSGGHAMTGVTVSYKVIPTTYLVGEFTGGPPWLNYVYTTGASPNPIVPFSCPNEDINTSNTLNDFGAGGTEDQNGDGQLTPRAATLELVEQSTGSAVTDQWGRAHFYLQYGKNFAYWVTYAMTFQVSVEGSEGRTTYTGRTAATVDDVNSAGTPSWLTSPYGSNVVRNQSTGAITQGTVATHTVTDTADNLSVDLCGPAPTPPTP